MKNIRIKKDINIKWTITTNGENISLANRDLTLYLITPYRTHVLLDYTVEDNIITTVYRGTEQKLCGEYSLTLFENKDKEGQTVVDKISAFKLVENTDKEIDDITDNLQIETVDLGSSNLDVIINGNGYTKEEIDDKLDSKADKSDIPSKVSELVNDSGYLSTIPSEYVTNTELEEQGYLTEHQDISHLATKDEVDDKLSNKVEKKDGYSLISDTEIERLSGIVNYDDSTINNEINSIKTEVSKKANATDIPTKISELVNDSGYLTEHQDISHLATKDEIPDVSEYITETELNAKGYATKTQLSNYITNSTADSKYQPKGDYITSIPDEYITETELNAKGYATKTELGNKLDTLIYNSDKENFATKTELSNYYTKQEIDNIQIWDCGEY